MRNFWDWLENGRLQESHARARLYPPAYGGIGLYPPCDYITHLPDALWYLKPSARVYKAIEGEEFSITHLKSDNDPSVFPKYKMPEDTSMQFKHFITKDTSTQPEKFIPGHLNTNGTNPEKFGNDERMPKDDPTNRFKDVRKDPNELDDYD